MWIGRVVGGWLGCGLRVWLMVLLSDVAERVADRALSVERVTERVWLSGAVGVWGLACGWWRLRLCAARGWFGLRPT